jgi:UDP-N-acetylglucosamine--N-acetylmuramyl-(pentapeptide) pyrophosphoryl-undecaprenol N-acetylglucosamine transferase
LRVLIAGGGTAGHINPGIAIAKHIKEKHYDAEIVFVGTQKGLETKLVTREGFELKLIKVRGFKRKLSFDTFVAVKELIGSLSEAARLIRDFKPDIVIGTGGYVCGPVLFSAARKKIPTLVHEQNAFPGVTNRLLSRFVNVVAISFKESEKFFGSAKKLVLTGNPIRKEMLEISSVNTGEKRVNNGMPVVVVFGGSRGAEKINLATVDMIKNNLKEMDCKVIFATGESQYEKIMKQLEGVSNKSLEVMPYIFDMANVMASADLVICRAGAITISELTALGVPSVMIPSPYVTANHQEHNARALEKQGAAEVILEKDLDGKLLYHKMISLIRDKRKLEEMGANARRVGVRDASIKIYSIINELINLNPKTV